MRKKLHKTSRKTLPVLTAIVVTAIGTHSHIALAEPLNPYHAPPVYSKRGINPPPDANPGPMYTTKQRELCTAQIGSDTGRFPNLEFMKLNLLHRAATGRGQKIAIIDTGVKPQPRLPHLINGGDYIAAGGDGFFDCDGHGTLVAGLIGAQPSPRDAFVGVAPDAQLISIRQNSEKYKYDASHVPQDELEKHPINSLDNLAAAIVHAANMGATVINYSGTSCFDVLQNFNTEQVKQALLYAVQVKNIVVVSAAGNTDDHGCKANPPGNDPGNPTDQRNWSGVTTVSIPSYYQPLVLSVGSTDNGGMPLKSSLTGPWVDVAAPGQNIASLNPGNSSNSKTLLVNNDYDPEKHTKVPISGTSFAAPLVAGLAALIRQKYPNLSAIQVINRIEATAHHPPDQQNNFVGFGAIDSLRALFNTVPVGPLSYPDLPTTILPPPPPPPPVDHTARTVALFVAGGAIGTIIIVGVSIFLRRKNI